MQPPRLQKHLSNYDIDRITSSTSRRVRIGRVSSLVAPERLCSTRGSGANILRWIFFFCLRKATYEKAPLPMVHRSSAICKRNDGGSADIIKAFSSMVPENATFLRTRFLAPPPAATCLSLASSSDRDHQGAFVVGTEGGAVFRCLMRHNDVMVADFAQKVGSPGQRTSLAHNLGQKGTA